MKRRSDVVDLVHVDLAIIASVIQRPEHDVAHHPAVRSEQLEREGVRSRLPDRIERSSRGDPQGIKIEQQMGQGVRDRESAVGRR